MSRGPRALSVLAIAVASALYAAVTGQHIPAALCALLALASLGRGALTPVSVPVQALLLVASGLVATGFGALLPAEGGLADRPLSRAWPLVGGGALVLAALRTHVARPEGGVAATLGLGLLVFLACGSVVSGAIYPALLVPYLMLCYGALRAADPARSPWRELGWRHGASFALVVGAAGSLSVAFALSLPKLYEGANSWALRWLESRPGSGFHDGAIALGSLRGMLQSDAIVMRIEGEVDEPLRGNVYARYARSHWLRPKGGPDSTVHAGAPLPDAGEAPTVIRYASSELDRFFLPGNADEIELEPARARVDETGVVRALAGQHPRRVRFRTGPARRFAVAEPGPDDLQIPDDLAPSLATLAAEWTARASSPAERVAAIRERLERDYTYSLSFERGASGRGADDALDPVLHFLLRDPQGHCEYFASAMALLARAADVPARVVTGYRVVERNPFAGYYVVRERHAHAWVEVHLPGRGWITVDPSPLRSFEGEGAATTAWLAAALDLAVFGWQRNGPAALLVALVAVFSAIQVRRLSRGGRRSRRIRGRAPSGPPPYIEELLARLRDLGLEHGRGESLEAYARRVARPPQEPTAAADATGRLCAAERLLLRYAALRYGGEGSAARLQAEVRSWLAAPLA